jgi:diguanylate cyclase (GGDEF)-like protein/putative nucleotidyltransferase with HDIG domain
MTSTPPVRRASLWAALRHAAIERMGDSEVRWRSLGVVFGAGGVLALASLAAPVEPGTEKLTIAALCCGAVVTAAAMIAGARRLPAGDLWIGAVLALGTLLITAGVYFTRTPASPYALLYVLVGFEGFFFLPRAAARWLLVWIGACYAAAMAAVDPVSTAPLGRWIMLMGTVTVVAVLADVLRERSDRLIARLRDAALTDPLTELLNRRGFEQLMEEELARAARSGQPLSLLVGDLDHFKTINDRFGHHEGDLALADFSAMVSATKRSIDGAARIGGEEFALALPSTDEHGAYLMAERLRRLLRDTAPRAGLTISFGIATHPGHGTTADDLLRNADQALYLAKRLGRDRSVIFSAEAAASFRASADGAKDRVEQVAAVLVLAETLDHRDTGTSQHSQTVGRYAEGVARELGFGREHVERVRLAGILHDIGKLGVPDPILRKPGKLDDDEWTEMRKHPELGARILAGANLDDISRWVLHHHERPDGFGYPSGLPLEEIPMESRILAVADAFEAMTADRVYRQGMSLDDAFAELRRNTGTQFDESIVDAFMATVGHLMTPPSPL